MTRRTIIIEDDLSEQFDRYCEDNGLVKGTASDLAVWLLTHVDPFDLRATIEAMRTRRQEVRVSLVEDHHARDMRILQQLYQRLEADGYTFDGPPKTPRHGGDEPPSTDWIVTPIETIRDAVGYSARRRHLLLLDRHEYENLDETERRQAVPLLHDVPTAGRVDRTAASMWIVYPDTPPRPFAFALMMGSDSMAPDYRVGDLMVFAPGEPEPGEPLLLDRTDGPATCVVPACIDTIGVETASGEVIRMDQIRTAYPMVDCLPVTRSRADDIEQRINEDRMSAEALEPPGTARPG
jgi:hypothetical protein